MHQRSRDRVVVDLAVGQIPRRGLRDELEKIYSTLAREGPHRETMKPYIRPQDFGYRSGPPSDRELMAEAVRAYMVDPNYLKTVAPKTAAAIRAAVNPNPKLREILQFNSSAAAAMPIAGALTEDDGESWDPERN